MQNQEFEVGDVVRLKGQRPYMPMHVTKIDSKGITCVWVDAYKRPSRTSISTRDSYVQGLVNIKPRRILLEVYSKVVDEAKKERIL